MGRKSSVWWNETRQMWFTTIKGKQKKLSADRKEADTMFYKLMIDKDKPQTGDDRQVASVCELFLESLRKKVMKKKISAGTLRFYEQRLPEFLRLAAS